jgi:hypothetical protein
MFCPECGFDAQDAKFCPDCGAGLSQLRASLEDVDDAPMAPRPAPRGRTTGAYRNTRPGAQRSRGQQARPRDTRSDDDRDLDDYRGPRPRATQSRLSPTMIWTAITVVIVLVIAGYFILGRSPANVTTGQAAAPITADTSGSYAVLVARANAFYDQGAKAFAAKNTSGGAQYFAAAGTVYRAAWTKQPGDPSVGTDFATSLFYAGDTAGAMKQIDAVLAKSPNFQNGRLNKGIFLQTASQTAQQSGQSASAKSLLAQAKAEFQKTVAIDPTSAAGQKAAGILKAL